MLVLSRQKDQTIIIGDDIEVTVVAIRGDKVSLGINAPRSKTVHRKEVYDTIKREERRAMEIDKGRNVAGGNGGGGRPAGFYDDADSFLINPVNYDLLLTLIKGDRAGRRNYLF